MLNKLTFTFLLALTTLPAIALGQDVGRVVEVRQPAQITSAGATQTASQGDPIASGDLIRTGASGQVQMLFPDETKIVIGANSSLRIDDTLFRANGTAKKFATSALGGSFRFISGKSRKTVYKLATPVATMGIRGTSFDYTVVGGQNTDLLVFNGLVRLCARGRQCADIPGGCQAASVDVNGRFSQPLTTAEKRALLLRRFSLLAEQTSLQPPFRASTAGCDRAVVINLVTVEERVDKRRQAESGGDNPADGPSDSDGDGGNPAE